MGFLLSSLAVGLTFFYTWKAWLAATSHYTSQRTRQLQQQFTKTLIAQVSRVSECIV